MIYSFFSIYLLVISGEIFVTSVRIASFNLQQYGPKKSSDATLTHFVARILNDFDLIVIQEITDVSGQAPLVLHNALNKVSKSGIYGMSISERVGHSSSKEQYIFFNREATSNVELVEAYLHIDTDRRFERPPFIGTFKVKHVGSSKVKFFTIIDVHLRPSAAYAEFLHLRYVIRDFIIRNPSYFAQTSSSLAETIAANVIEATASNKPHLKTNHPILIIGDFNADGYISATQQETLRSIHFADFVWMIENSVKTNTRQTHTYDRILINGANFVKAIIRNSNTTVNFQQRFGMSLDQALDISDHFPVKFDITW